MSVRFAELRNVVDRGVNILRKKVKLSFEKSGEYHKELGIRLIKGFKCVNIVIGLWNWSLRLEVR